MVQITIKLKTMKKIIITILCIIGLYSCTTAQTVIENTKTNLPPNYLIITGTNVTKGVAPGANLTIWGIVNNIPGYYPVSAYTNGVTGPAGPQGATGATGPQGPIGATGAQGVAGTTPTNVLIIPAGMKDGDVITMQGGALISKPASFLISRTFLNQTTAIITNVDKITTSACSLSASIFVNSISAGSVTINYSYTDPTGKIVIASLGIINTIGSNSFGLQSLNITPNTTVNISTVFATGTVVNYTISTALRENN